MPRAQQIRDARLLLDWLEAHPAVPLPDLNLAAILHLSPKAAAAVMDRASSTSRTPIEVTPAGGKVLRREIGCISYRLVVLPPPAAPEPVRAVPPHEHRIARIRKPQQRPSRGRALTERPSK
ncbi:hypothetical protein [Actinomadura sp. WMMA1423]|uniref:hypothetical protein n=1 Tax=Actinomadura sp. WMMA1423 TaxID=2591108 RepID=UPI00114774C9|nr:hypothetical protein [Actinomadura sp. WMMA1423]